MEYNSKSCIFITILLVCDFKFALGGQCYSGYYDCVGHKWCCPHSYKCTGYTIDCYSYTTYYTSGSSGPSAMDYGKIVVGLISCIIALLLIIRCILHCCVCVGDTITGDEDSIKETESQPQTGSESGLENGNVSYILIPIRGPIEPGYPPPPYQH